MVWSDELAYLRYGLGNFYSIDGVITHYHNWYDRAFHRRNESQQENEKDLPLWYIDAYTQTFLADYDRGELVIPSAANYDRKPIAL
jgi:hypothetical protein